jgi:hypothetical protein
MARGIATVEVKRSHGKMIVQGLGRTPRGQKFIRYTTGLEAKGPTDKLFKTQMAQAISRMFAESPPNP